MIVVILGVRTDPYLSDLLAFTISQRTVVLAHSHRPKALTDRLKVQGRVPGILTPKGLVFIGGAARGSGQRLVATPKTVGAK